MIDENSLEKIDKFTFKLPNGAYWDDEEMLRSADGDLLPDGLYQDSEGNIFSYEGNFLKRFS